MYLVYYIRKYYDHQIRVDRQQLLALNKSLDICHETCNFSLRILK